MRKTTLSVAAAVATVALLAACSGGEAETPEAEPTSAAPTATGNLVVWVDENRKPAVEAAAAGFTEETGVTVETVVKNFDDIRADFLAQVPTGEGPDITIGAHDWLGGLVTNGVVDTVDISGREAEFVPVALEALTSDGQLYGLPYALESVALVRNTALVPDPAPATFDEMIAAGREAGTKLPFVINTNGATGDGYNYYAFQQSFGAPVFVQNEDGSYTNEVGMGGDEGYAFADWLGANGMKGDGVFSTDFTADIAEQEFADGNAPFAVAGPWSIAKFTDAGIDVAVEPIPSAGGETAAPFVGVQAFYLSAQSENKLLASQFLTNYIATPEAMQALYDADPRLPAFVETADAVASDPIVAGFQAVAETGTPMPNIPEMDQVWEHWNAAEASIISGSAEPKAAWDKMLADLDGALNG